MSVMSVKERRSTANQETWVSEMETDQRRASIKRVLGEDLFSKKFRAQKVEGGLKIMLYNKFIRL
jgi:hypothetical protein